MFHVVCDQKLHVSCSQPAVRADAFYWNFYQDGTIDYQIKLTGELSTNALSPHELEMGKVRPPAAGNNTAVICLLISRLSLHELPCMGLPVLQPY